MVLTAAFAERCGEMDALPLPPLPPGGEVAGATQLTCIYVASNQEEDDDAGNDEEEEESKLCVEESDSDCDESLRRRMARLRWKAANMRRQACGAAAETQPEEPVAWPDVNLADPRLQAPLLHTA